MNIGTFDTIVAPATVPGTGAISLIRVSGPETFSIVGKTVRLQRTIDADSAGYTIRYGSICGKDGNTLDEVLVSIFRAPHSYTGEDSAEISCHASQFIVNEVLSLLVEAGARIAEPGEFTKRAFINGKMDLSQAESVADLIASQDAAAHRIAMNQLKGGISNGLRELREKILEMSSLMELELDFSEEDVEFADRTRLLELVEIASGRIDHMVGSFRMGNAIRNGVPVAIAGPANAGKSTLLNALCGEERAIVSDIAGTTRDSIEEICIIDGIRFRFIDTAGIRDTDETIEKLGIERTYRHMQKADIVLIMLDGSEDPARNVSALQEIIGRLRGRKFDGAGVDDGIGRAGEDRLDDCGVDRIDGAGEDGMDDCGVDGVDGIDGAAEVEMVGCGGDVDGLGDCGVDGIGSSCADAISHTGNFQQGFGCSSYNGDSSESGVKGNASSINQGYQKVAVLINKCDKIGDNKNVIHINKYVSLIDSQIVCLNISAKFDNGLQSLKQWLSDSCKDLSKASEDLTTITNQRHLEALVRARSSLLRVRDGLSSGLPSDLVAQDLREVSYHLGTIVGDISTDEVLGNIFRKFCIGK